MAAGGRLAVREPQPVEGVVRRLFVHSRVRGRVLRSRTHRARRHARPVVSQRCHGVSTSQSGAAECCRPRVVDQSAIHHKRSTLMKITVIKKASSTRKPQNFCPWIIDEYAPADKKG